MKSKKHDVQEKRATSTDWNEVRRRLQSSRETLERQWAPGAENKKEMLRARARALAQEPRAEELDKDRIEVVEFFLAHEQYGIESAYVREVYPLREFTRVPCTPPFVLGIMNVRGKVLSILDLTKFFDLPEEGLTDLNKVIILHNDRMEFGILADVILGVRKISLNELQTSLPTLTGIREKYLKGVTTERVVILDGEKLLMDKKIIVRETVEN
jgi:purine-binding chemotaxis protein CheW